MDPTELLAKQIQNYQEQNIRDHEKLNTKIDQILDMLHAITMEQSSHKKRIEDIEDKEEEINSLNDRVKELEAKQTKREHIWGWVAKCGAVAITIGTIIGFFIRYF